MCNPCANAIHFVIDCTIHTQLCIVKRPPFRCRWAEKRTVDSNPHMHPHRILCGLIKSWTQFAGNLKTITCNADFHEPYRRASCAVLYNVNRSIRRSIPTICRRRICVGMILKCLRVVQQESARNEAIVVQILAYWWKRTTSNYADLNSVNFITRIAFPKNY